jgi:hypothetical protein
MKENTYTHRVKGQKQKREKKKTEPGRFLSDGTEGGKRAKSSGAPAAAVAAAAAA